MQFQFSPRLLRHSGKNVQYLIAYILILFLPAFFWNLGYMPFILDEATRANVALEMLFSGNYIVPTINGEFYYNKPPLFNWLLVGMIKITNGKNEFVLRLPAVLSMLFFALSIYKTQKKAAGREVAFYSALAFVTCGRILFYDSFKALLDITFSWIIYMIFWYIYTFGRRKEYFNLFMTTYLLATIGFLMKGLPSLVFLGISLFFYFLINREFKKLFTWEHFAGFSMFAVITGAYLFVYSRYNSLDVYFATLWEESSKRTFLDNSIWESIKHIFLFPFYFIYHFLPWTLFVLVFVFGYARKELGKDSFARYALMIFFTNIVIYWVSPAIYPRYLFMFLPLLFYINFRGYQILTGKLNPGKLSLLIRMLVALLMISIFLIPLMTSIEIYSNFWMKYIVSIIFAIPFILASFSPKSNTILLLAGSLLVVRIAFNLFVLPDRNESDSYQYEKNGAKVAAELTGSFPLYVLGDTRIHHATSFYIMQTKGNILRRWEGKPVEGVFYIVEKEYLKQLEGYDEIFTFQTRFENLKLSLIQIE